MQFKFRILRVNSAILVQFLVLGPSCLHCVSECYMCAHSIVLNHDVKNKQAGSAPSADLIPFLNIY